MRRTGKTTRLVDQAIQMLFTHGKIWVPPTPQKRFELLSTGVKEEVIIFDADAHITSKVQIIVFDTIYKRLKFEHRVDYRENFKINLKAMTMEFINKKEV